jgi:hypothetical protein
MSVDASFDGYSVLPPAGEPDFSQWLKVLNRNEPERPTLFEFFPNDHCEK